MSTIPTPITDEYESRLSGCTGHVHRGWGELCRKLERALIEERRRNQTEVKEAYQRGLIKGANANR